MKNPKIIVFKTQEYDDKGNYGGDSDRDSKEFLLSSINTFKESVLNSDEIKNAVKCVKQHGKLTKHNYCRSEMVIKIHEFDVNVAEYDITIKYNYNLKCVILTTSKCCGISFDVYYKDD